MNIGGHALGDHQRFEFLIGGEQLQRTSKAVYRNAQMLGRSRRRRNRLRETVPIE